MNSTCSIPVDAYVVASQDKRGSVVLERNWIGGTVLSPVVDIGRELVSYQHFTFPLYSYNVLLTVQMPPQLMSTSLTIGLSFEAM
jgi:hypothetical protein